MQVENKETCIVQNLYSFMTVEDKIEDTERNLNRIKKALNEDNLNEDDVKDHLRAFLNDARSILDFLLSDFAEKYGLGIDLETRDLWNQFIKRAKEKNNSDAVNFHKFFVKKYEELTKDDIAKIMLRNRKLNIHRKSIPPSPAAFIVSPEIDKKNIFMRIETVNQKAAKKVQEELAKFMSEVPSSIRPSVNTKPIFVLKNSNFELIQSCDYYFSLLRNFVSEIYQWEKT